MSALTRVARVEATLEPFEWPWREANRDRIAQHWAMRRAQIPAMFNGSVLMVARATIADGLCRARFFETDYAALTAWKAFGVPGEDGRPDDGVRNGFAMGALLGRDGGFILGRMAAHTAAAGRVYFPCGTPDSKDVTPTGAVDLARSATREIEEETGLLPDAYQVEPGWTIVDDRGLMAFIRLARLKATAEAVQAEIRRFIAADPGSELADVQVVRSLADVAGADMPGVVPLYLAEAFGEAEARAYG